MTFVEKFGNLERGIDTYEGDINTFKEEGAIEMLYLGGIDTHGWGTDTWQIEALRTKCIDTPS